VVFGVGLDVAVPDERGFELLVDVVVLLEEGVVVFAAVQLGLLLVRLHFSFAGAFAFLHRALERKVLQLVLRVGVLVHALESLAVVVAAALRVPGFLVLVVCVYHVHGFYARLHDFDLGVDEREVCHDPLLLGAVALEHVDHVEEQLVLVVVGGADELLTLAVASPFHPELNCSVGAFVVLLGQQIDFDFRLIHVDERLYEVVVHVVLRFEQVTGGHAQHVYLG